jgi:hypothetical protein
MDRYLHDTVSALAYALATGRTPEEFTEFRPPYNDLTSFILEQQYRLPDFLRFPMRTVTLGFDLIGILRAAREFHRQPLASRQRQAIAWKNSSISAKRDFVRYYESLVMLALLSRYQGKAGGDSVNLSPRPLGISPSGVLQSPTSELRCEIAVVGSGPGGAVTSPPAFSPKPDVTCC